jgi:hypothetical protein
MDLNGSLTIALKSEEDVIVIGQFLKERRSSGATSNGIWLVKHAEKDRTRANMRRLTTTEIEVTNRLRAAFPTGTFTRRQAIELLKISMNISAWTIGHIISKAIKRKALRRLRKGEFTFDMIEEAPSDDDSNVSYASSRDKKQKRNFSNKRRSVLRTLENPLLFFNFVRKLNELNPSPVDEEIIDRTLEPQEALNELKKRYPDLITFKEENRDFLQEFRDYLICIGIDNAKVQDLVIARMESDDAFSEDELKAFARAQQSAIQKKQ